MEDRIPVFVHTELSEPKKRVLRSDGALYLLLLFGTIGCILLSRWLAARFGVLRIIVQAALYVVLLGTGYAIYRFRLVAFRYTLTDCDFSVRQVVGSREKLLLTVPLDRIVSIGAAQKDDRPDGKTYAGRRTEAICVRYRDGGQMRALYLSASAQLQKLLTESANAN